MKFFNKKSITIYTIIALFLAMLTFEIGYCNTEFINGIINHEKISYNFSPCRVILYVVFMILYLIFKNRFINTALETIKSKYKRIITYVIICLSILIICSIGLYTINKGIEYMRAGSIVIILAILSTIFIIYVSNNAMQNVIITSCTFGIIFTFTTSYNHAIDEKKHFMSALNVSFLNFDYTTNPITDKKIEELPQLSKFTSISEFLKDDYVQEVTTDVDKEDIPSTPADYNVITYIAPGIGIAVSRILGGSIIDMYICGRIMNLIIYTILVCIAIKLLPYKKNIFYIIAFMPFMILLAASYSADGICLGIVYIFVAYCLKLHENNEAITLKQFLLLALVYVIMLLGKSIAYMMIIVLAFMLPLGKTIKKNKKYIPAMVTCAVILVILGTFFLLNLKNQKLNAEADTRGGSDINAAEQLNVLLFHPIFDVKLAFEHVEDTLLNFYWYSHLHQSEFFTVDGEYTTFLIMMLFILYVSLTEDDHNFKIKDKIILILAFLLAFGFSSAVLYLTFTPVGALYVAGYQARYIFPIIPLILSCISNNKVKYIKSENRNMNIAAISGLFLVIGLLQLIIV